MVVHLARHDGGRVVAAHAVRVPDGAHHRLLLHEPRGGQPPQGRRAGRDLHARHRPDVHRAWDGHGAARRRDQPEPVRRQPVDQHPDHGDLPDVRAEPVRRVRHRPAAGAGQPARRAHQAAGRESDAGDAADGPDLHAHLVHLHGAVHRHPARDGGGRRMAVAAGRHARLLDRVRAAVLHPGAGAPVDGVAPPVGGLAELGEGADGLPRDRRGDEVPLQRGPDLGMGHLHPRRRSRRVGRHVRADGALRAGAVPLRARGAGQARGRGPAGHLHGVRHRGALADDRAGGEAARRTRGVPPAAARLAEERCDHGPGCRATCRGS